MTEDPALLDETLKRNDEKVTPTEPLYSLTSLRFFGSLAVFFFHAIDICNRQTVVFGSASAVSLFFVLSGFILVYIYQKKLVNLRLWGFYAKRFARLWPLHIACLLLVLIFQYNILSDPQTVISREGFWPKLVLNVLMLQSLVPSFDWALSFNGVAWFLSTEFCFCLMFPFLARGGGKGIFWVWLGSFTLLAVGLMLTNGYLAKNPDSVRDVGIMIQCNPFFRLFEFTSGMMVGYLFLRGIRLPSGRFAIFIHTLAEIVAISFLAVSLHTGPLTKWMFHYCHDMGWTTTITWLAKGGSSLPASLVLIWVMTTSRGPIGTLLSQPFLVFLGKLSYSFYMVHYVIMLLIVRNCPTHVSPVTMILAGLILSLAAASLLNLLVENPFRNLLVRLLDRKQKAMSQASFTAQPMKNMIYPTLIVNLIGLIGFWALYTESKRDPMTAPILHGQINFGESAILHHVQSNLTETHLELLLVWEKQPKFNAIRFGHIIDAEDKFRNLPSNQRLFTANRIGIEKILIPRNELEGAVGIGVGLLENGKTIKFSNRARNLTGWRLSVYDCESDSVPKRVVANTKKMSTIGK